MDATTGREHPSPQQVDLLRLLAVGLVVRPRVNLTPREREVVALIAAGLTARQVARRLVLSPRTVEHHVQRILRRTGQPNRAALVRWAIEQRVV